MTQAQNATPNTGVIAIVIDGNYMKHPLVPGLPRALDGMIRELGIKARVVLPELVHTDEDSNVAMSRNVEHLSDGPQPSCGNPLCESCAQSGEDAFLAIVDSGCQSSDILIAACMQSMKFKAAGISMKAQCSPPGVESPEHFFFVRDAWMSEVEDGETELGYWDWVDAQVAMVLEGARCTGRIPQEAETGGPA